MAGVALFIGIMGAVSAGTPLRILVHHFDWRSVIMASALLMLAVATLVWVFVRDYPHERGFQDYAAPNKSRAEQSMKGILDGILEVFRYRNTILLFIIPGGIVGSVLTFSGLWGVPFLSTHHGLNTTQAAALTSTLWLPWPSAGRSPVGFQIASAGENRFIYAVQQPR